MPLKTSKGVPGYICGFLRDFEENLIVANETRRRVSGDGTAPFTSGQASS
jgi:hypothetical protein